VGRGGDNFGDVFGDFREMRRVTKTTIRGATKRVLCSSLVHQIQFRLGFPTPLAVKRGKGTGIGGG